MLFRQCLTLENDATRHRIFVTRQLFTFALRNFVFEYFLVSGGGALE
jgi:hypothetical protein